MTELKVEKYYKRIAKDMTDMLFDKDFLNSELTRKSIDKLENYIGFMFQSISESAIRGSQLLASLKGIKK